MSMYGEIRTTVDTGPGLTKQSFREQVNINKIVAGFEKTGMVNNLSGRQPFYGDVSEIKDYATALNMVNEAESLFMSMSPKIREKFENDPAKMIAFLGDSKNLDEAVSLGMAVKRPVEPQEPSSGAPAGK